MKRYLLFFLLFICSCTTAEQLQHIEPEYNHLVDHMVVVDKGSNFVVYEYSDIRIDEITPVAAIYCHEKGNKQASLYDINLRSNHSRRATFVCQ